MRGGRGWIDERRMRHELLKPIQFPFIELRDRTLPPLSKCRDLVTVAARGSCCTIAGGEICCGHKTIERIPRSHSALRG